jgi:very-short-patch-repair endonuclease
MKNYQTHNRPELKENRKALRNNSTSPEAFLWNYLKGKQLKGRKFRRQFSVGNFILDFYCPAEKLCIELDGADHFTSAGYEYDEKRTSYLNKLGIIVIRFENETVFNATENVLESIMSYFKEE